jgi:hypothetical protein
MYEKPLFFTVDNMPYMALSGYFNEHAGVYALMRRDAQDLRLNGNTHVVEHWMTKMEYRHGS